MLFLIFLIGRCTKLDMVQLLRYHQGKLHPNAFIDSHSGSTLCYRYGNLAENKPLGIPASPQRPDGQVQLDIISDYCQFSTRNLVKSDKNFHQHKFTNSVIYQFSTTGLVMFHKDLHELDTQRVRFIEAVGNQLLD